MFVYQIYSGLLVIYFFYFTLLELFKMPSNKTKYCVRIVVDVLLLIAVIACIFLVKKLWPSFERGMFCNDRSLYYPFIESDTISDAILLFFGVAVPIVVICVVEFIRVRKENVGKQVQLFGKPLNSWFWAVYSSVGVFLFGCACTQLFTDIGKYSLGILRPNFIEICNPDWQKINCSSSILSYIDPIVCLTSESDTKLKDARQSFPSGHASFSAFTMIYLVIYLQMRLHIRNFKLLKPVIQLLCFFFTFYTCLTRVSDYKHHWEDVVGGFLLGSIVAVLVSVFVSDLCSGRSTKVSKGQVVLLQDYHQTRTEDLNSSQHLTP